MDVDGRLDGLQVFSRQQREDDDGGDDDNVRGTSVRAAAARCRKGRAEETQRHPDGRDDDRDEEHHGQVHLVARRCSEIAGLQVSAVHYTYTTSFI